MEAFSAFKFLLYNCDSICLWENETCRDAATVCRDRGERDQGVCPDAATVCRGEGEREQGTRTPPVSTGCHSARPCDPAQPCYPRLPDAIAPSLAATPEFARRNSWCHAIEVNFIPKLNM